jgi:hypothetical protein
MSNTDNNEKECSTTEDCDTIEYDTTKLVSRESELIGIINTLQQKIEDLEIRLKKYTNGENHKRYYEKNKNKIKETGSTYLKKLKEENPEKIKEYSRNAYLKKKQKKDLEDALLMNNIDINTKNNIPVPANVGLPASVENALDESKVHS